MNIDCFYNIRATGGVPSAFAALISISDAISAIGGVPFALMALVSISDAMSAIGMSCKSFRQQCLEDLHGVPRSASPKSWGVTRSLNETERRN